MALPINLPVIQRRVLDHSIASTLDECPRKTLYKYVYNRKSFEEDTQSADFGTHYHKYRETVDKLLQENPDSPFFAVHIAAVEEAKKGFVQPDSEGKKSYLDLNRLIKSCEAARERIQKERQTGSHKILHSEVSFELPLPSDRLYGGRFDQILEWNKRLWVRDFKTTSWLASNLRDKYALHHQFTGYVWAAQQLSGRSIDGVLVEVLHNTSKDVAKIIPVMTTRTEQDIVSFIEWAEDRWDEWERRMESGIWPMRTISCYNFNKPCAFHKACSEGDYTAIETWLKENSEESVWDFANPHKVEVE